MCLFRFLSCISSSFVLSVDDCCVWAAVFSPLVLTVVCSFWSWAFSRFRDSEFSLFSSLISSVGSVSSWTETEGPDGIISGWGASFGSFVCSEITRWIIFEVPRAREETSCSSWRSFPPAISFWWDFSIFKGPKEVQKGLKSDNCVFNHSWIKISHLLSSL